MGNSALRRFIERKKELLRKTEKGERMAAGMDPGRQSRDCCEYLSEHPKDVRSLENLKYDDAKASGWKILKDLQCEVVGKAVFEQKYYNLKIMKSTKRFKVEGGWIYNTSTEVHKGTNVSVAEALCFVPEKQ